MKTTGDIVCEICGDKPPEKNRKLCSACRKRLQRKGLPEKILYPHVEVVVSSLAQLLPVDTNEPFSKQQVQALRLDKRAVHNTRQGKDEWVIPGSCKWGFCLNPKCVYHKEVHKEDSGV